MLLLLPPSETKRTGGSGAFDPTALRHPESLRSARERVRGALETVSSDPESAVKALKLGVKNRDEAERNLELESSGVLPAIERYTGVLYDALDVASLDAEARAWLHAHVAVQSALFGLIGAGDPIPAYRLSASSRLPTLSAPMKRIWAEAHEHAGWHTESDFILDLRSQDYAALAPLPEGEGWFLHVAQRAENGEVRALNHFNKSAKGNLVRRLATSAARIDDIDGLLAWAAAEQLEMHIDVANAVVTLVTDHGAPGRASVRASEAG